MAKKKILNGIIPPMLTPLQSNLDLDPKGVKNLIKRMMDGGVHGLFILGTTGESTGLSYRTRHDLIKQACEYVNRRVPLLVGITDTSCEESLKLAMLAYELGADAVVAAPPYYYPLGQEELFEYYSDLADNSKLPLFLYNMPSTTKIDINVDTVVRLSKHPNIIGLKDSSANTVYFQALRHAINREDFSLFVGPEEILAETVLLGGNGGVNGGANLFPKLYVQMYEAAMTKDHLRIEVLQNYIMKITTLLYKVGKYNSSYLKGLKGAASVLGICNATMAPPLKPFLSKEMLQISKNLRLIESDLNQIL